MCTLILGCDVLEPGSVVIAANRDENPERVSEPPRILSESPRVAGGRDAVAGGTWLAVRERLGVVALLNRRPVPGAAIPAATRRSRGLLTLDVASVAIPAGETFAAAAQLAARAAFARDPYAPCTLLLASPQGCWAASRRDGATLEFESIPAGWHVITHADLDDRTEPRTRWLMDDLAAFAPRSADEAIAGLRSRLRLHEGDRDRSPAVCLHQGPMVTVSSAAIVLGRDRHHYLHIEGPACTGGPVDATPLLRPAPAPGPAL